jgi:hypothetical protein
MLVLPRCTLMNVDQFLGVVARYSSKPGGFLWREGSPVVIFVEIARTHDVKEVVYSIECGKGDAEAGESAV